MAPIVLAKPLKTELIREAISHFSLKGQSGEKICEDFPARTA